MAEVNLKQGLKTFDRDLAFTYYNGTPITVDGVSDTIDLGSEDAGKGEQIKGVIVVHEAPAGTNPVMDITVCSESADTTPEDVIMTIPQITAKGIYYFSLPESVKRYVALNYNIGGTGSPSFKITAFLTAELR
jgi:hypothetical protein